MKQLYNDIIEWQNKTFPEKNCKNIIENVLHLFDEVMELIKDIKLGDMDHAEEELADIIMMTMAVSFAMGLEYDDVIAEIKRKFEINKNKKMGDSK